MEIEKLLTTKKVMEQLWIECSDSYQMTDGEQRDSLGCLLKSMSQTISGIDKRIEDMKNPATKALLEGKVVVWGKFPELSIPPRYYRYNSNDNCIEYTDDKCNWNKSTSFELKNFNEKEPWQIVEL